MVAVFWECWTRFRALGLFEDPGTLNSHDLSEDCQRTYITCLMSSYYFTQLFRIPGAL